MTSGHAHAPAAAFLLIDQNDAVFFPLVDGPRWARGEAGGVEAMLAQPWQIHHEGFFEVDENFLLDPFEVVIMAAILEFAAQHSFPVAYRKSTRQTLRH